MLLMKAAAFLFLPDGLAGENHKSFFSTKGGTPNRSASE